MKLLFDANLSPKLATAVQDLFPESDHVFNTADLAEDDRMILSHAVAHGFAIVTKDSDFAELSQMMDVAPKIVWIRRGNGSTSMIERMLRRNADAIKSLDEPFSKLQILILL